MNVLSYSVYSLLSDGCRPKLDKAGVELCAADGGFLKTLWTSGCQAILFRKSI